MTDRTPSEKDRKPIGLMRDASIAAWAEWLGDCPGDRAERVETFFHVLSFLHGKWMGQPQFEVGETVDFDTAREAQARAIFGDEFYERWQAWKKDPIGQRGGTFRINKIGGPTLTVDQPTSDPLSRAKTRCGATGPGGEGPCRLFVGHDGMHQRGNEEWSANPKCNKCGAGCDDTISLATLADGRGYECNECSLKDGKIISAANYLVHLMDTKASDEKGKRALQDLIALCREPRRVKPLRPDETLAAKVQCALYVLRKKGPSEASMRRMRRDLEDVRDALRMAEGKDEESRLMRKIVHAAVDWCEGMDWDPPFGDPDDDAHVLRECVLNWQAYRTPHPTPGDEK